MMCAPGNAAGGVSCGSSQVLNADQAYMAAVNRNPALGSHTLTIRPPMAGPANDPMLSIVLAAVFAAVSSSGVSASEGRRAARAGVNAVPAMLEQAASP